MCVRSRALHRTWRSKLTNPDLIPRTVFGLKFINWELSERYEENLWANFFTKLEFHSLNVTIYENDFAFNYVREMDAAQLIEIVYAGYLS